MTKFQYISLFPTLIFFYFLLHPAGHSHLFAVFSPIPSSFAFPIPISFCLCSFFPTFSFSFIFLSFNLVILTTYKQLMIKSSTITNSKLNQISHKIQTASPNQKTTSFPIFLRNSPFKKKQINPISEPLCSIKLATLGKISPLKALRTSNSPQRVRKQMATPPKPIKPIFNLKGNQLRDSENNKQFYKSSIMTQDSESNFNIDKQRVIQRCKSLWFRNLRQSQIVHLKKSREKNPETLKQNTERSFTPKKQIHRLDSNVKQLKIIKPFTFITKIQDFVFVCQLGRGYHSVVYLAKHKNTGMIFAIKVMLKQLIKQGKREQNIFRELKIHSFLRCGNVVTLYKILDDQRYIYMIMEYCQGGNLYSILKKQRRFDEERASRIIRDIANGVKHLHDNHIIHRDLKLQNIVLSEGIAKIADYGCAVHSYSLRKSKIGSPAYLSPQQLNHHYYGKKIDIWSIGVICYQLLFESTPFDKQVIDALKKGSLNFDMKLKFPTQVPISENAKSFLFRCLQKKQKQRLQIDEVLEHPFLNQH